MRISRTNPHGGKFPGGRDANELVLYTPAHGPRTGTNQYGIEAVVRGGIVTSCEGNNSRIPRDGFVLSGHGRASEWILANLSPGTEVEVSGTLVRGHYTLKSKLYEIRRRLKTLGEPGTGGARRDAKKAAEIAGRAEPLLDTDDRAAAERLLAEADRFSRAAAYASVPSVSREARGVWFRLQESGEEGARNLVRRAAGMNLNMLFPETLYWSTTLCPQLGPDAPPQNPAFRGSDPLAVLIKEGHARGMQVHAWCEVFFIGPGDPELARRHPEWLAVDRTGATRARAEEEFRFFCPANPEPREYLLRQMEALVRRYPLDGIQLDYIRYPRTETPGDSFCYCDYCRRAFREHAGVDPRQIGPEKDAAAWRKWTRWREDRVSSFVREAHGRLHAARPGIVVSAAVFPEMREARGHKMQNWPLWAKEGWLDLLCMMNYRTDAAGVESVTRRNMKQAAGLPVYVGLGPFLHLTEEQLVGQVEASRRAGSGGQVHFCEEAMTAAQREALIAGPYRKPATVPGAKRR